MRPGLLLIDNESPLRKTLADRFHKGGYRIFTASNMAEVEMTIHRKRIDVILLVLVTLKQEGIRILDRLRDLAPQSEVLLVNDPEQIALSIDAMKSGVFDDFLLPLDMHHLLERVGEAVRRKRSQTRKHISLKQRFNDMMMAVSFAEAGEPEAAQRFLDGSNKGNPSSFSKNERKQGSQTTTNQLRRKTDGKDKTTAGG